MSTFWGLGTYVGYSGAYMLEFKKGCFLSVTSFLSLELASRLSIGLHVCFPIYACIGVALCVEDCLWDWCSSCVCMYLVHAPGVLCQKPTGLL